MPFLVIYAILSTWHGKKCFMPAKKNPGQYAGNVGRGFLLSLVLDTGWVGSCYLLSNVFLVLTFLSSIILEYSGNFMSGVFTERISFTMYSSKNSKKTYVQWCASMHLRLLMPRKQNPIVFLRRDGEGEASNALDGIEKSAQSVDVIGVGTNGAGGAMASPLFWVGGQQC